jgi:hypothetical protein
MRAQVDERARVICVRNTLMDVLSPQLVLLMGRIIVEALSQFAFVVDTLLYFRLIVILYVWLTVDTDIRVNLLWPVHISVALLSVYHPLSILLLQVISIHVK